MIALLGAGLLQVPAHLRVARQQRLALVERLRGDLASVIDAHETGGVVALWRGECAVRGIRRGARGDCILALSSNQGVAGASKDGVQRAQPARHAQVSLAASLGGT